MTRDEAAQRLHGCEYRNEGSHELWAQMKAAGLVAVFGASDDLCEFRGAIHDEVGCCDGGEAYLTPKGLLENECSEGACPYHEREREKAAFIEIVCDDQGEGPFWTYETTIPHATFDVVEDGEVYCRGIVFALADVPGPGAATEAPSPISASTTDRRTTPERRAGEYERARAE